MRISDWSSDVCSSDLLAALVPLIFHARDRAGLDAGTALKPLGRDAGQGRAAHLIAGALPFVARHAQHGRFAGAGIADDDCQVVLAGDMRQGVLRSEEHTSELQSLMRISYAVFCLKNKTKSNITNKMQLRY